MRRTLGRPINTRHISVLRCGRRRNGLVDVARERARDRVALEVCAMVRAADHLRVLENDVPGVHHAGEVSQDGEEKVEEECAGTEASLSTLR